MFLYEYLLWCPWHVNWLVPVLLQLFFLVFTNCPVITFTAVWTIMMHLSALILAQKYRECFMFPVLYIHNSACKTRSQEGIIGTKSGKWLSAVQMFPCSTNGIGQVQAYFSISNYWLTRVQYWCIGIFSTVHVYTPQYFYLKGLQPTHLTLTFLEFNTWLMNWSGALVCFWHKIVQVWMVWTTVYGSLIMPHYYITCIWFGFLDWFYLTSILRWSWNKYGALRWVWE